MPIDIDQLAGSLSALTARVAFHQRLGFGTRSDWRTAAEQLEIGDFLLLVEPQGNEFIAKVGLPMSKHDSARVLQGRGVAQRFRTAADARRWCEAMFLHILMAECTAMGLGWPSATKNADDDEWARRHVAALQQCNSKELRGGAELVLRMISGDWSGIETMGREHFAGSSAEAPATDSGDDMKPRFRGRTWSSRIVAQMHITASYIQAYRPPYRDERSTRWAHDVVLACCSVAEARRILSEAGDVPTDATESDIVVQARTLFYDMRRHVLPALDDWPADSLKFVSLLLSPTEIDRMAERLARASWVEPETTLPPREFAERWSAVLVRMIRQCATPELIHAIFGDDGLEMPSVQAHLDELARSGRSLPDAVSVTHVREAFDLVLREQVMAWAEPRGSDALELVREVFSKSNVETMIKWLFGHEGDAEPKHTGADR